MKIIFISSWDTIFCFALNTFLGSDTNIKLVLRQHQPLRRGSSITRYCLSWTFTKVLRTIENKVIIWQFAQIDYSFKSYDSCVFEILRIHTVSSCNQEVHERYMFEEYMFLIKRFMKDIYAWRVHVFNQEVHERYMLEEYMFLIKRFMKDIYAWRVHVFQIFLAECYQYLWLYQSSAVQLLLQSFVVCYCPQFHFNQSLLGVVDCSHQNCVIGAEMFRTAV